MKTIIVACNSGVATSGMVAAKINNMLAARGYSGKATADTVSFRSLESVAQSGGVDIFVTISPSSPIQLNVPTFNGIAFLTNMGAEEVMDEIIKLL